VETVKTHVFSNGLPAVYLHSPSVRVYTVILLVGAGSRFETLENQGISRFYANISFQGSEQYPDKNQLGQAIDRLGLSIRPTVYPEYSLYYFSSVEEKLLPSLELFFQIFFQPALNEQGLKNEKQLTLSEIEITNKNPRFLGVNKLTSSIFNNASIGFDILGSEQGVQNINLERLKTFKNKFYVSQNCLLVLVGPKKDFSLESLENLSSVVSSGERQTFPSFDFSQTKVIQEKISQLGKISYLTFGYPCYGRSSSKRIAQSLLLNILSEGRTDRRLRTLREKKLVLTIKPAIKIFSDCGLFLAQASCNSVREKEVKEEVLAQFKDLSAGSITQEELDRAKSFYQNRLLERLSSGLELGFFYALGCFFNLKEQSPEAVIERMKTVTLEEIKQMCGQIFREDSISWVIVGPGY